MSISFRPGVRENVGLWINLIGPSGGGKTFTAFRLASGIAGDKPFAVIDTENRRALHYADQFKFDHCELNPPFRPEAYTEAVKAADAAGYPVIVIDSGSHVWSGTGGVLDWQEEEIARLGGGNNVKLLSWAKPKAAHKKMMQEFLRTKAHIILCLRAEEKVEMVKKPGGGVEILAKKTLTGRDGFIPICEKSLPFEATTSFLLLPSNPGFPQPIKLQEQHKALFPLDQPINEESGKRLAEWAAGGKAKKEDDLPKRRASVIEYFGKMAVDPSRILASINRRSIDDVDEADLKALQVKAALIKKGELPIEEAFPEINNPAYENVSEVTTDTEAENVQKQLIHKLEERVYQVGELQLGKGQKARYGNRENLKPEALQELLDELG